MSRYNIIAFVLGWAILYAFSYIYYENGSYNPTNNLLVGSIFLGFLLIAILMRIFIKTESIRSFSVMFEVMAFYGILKIQNGIDANMIVKAIVLSLIVGLYVFLIQRFGRKSKILDTKDPDYL